MTKQRHTDGIFRTTAQVLVAGLVLLAIWPSAAATISVTEYHDTQNDADGTCTLREAIRSANQDIAIDDCEAGQGGTVVDRIILQGGIYTVDLVNVSGEDNAVDGDLDVVGDVEISGVGADLTIIDGVAGQSVERVIEIVDGEFTIRDVTVQGGSSLGGGVGGNIYSRGNSEVDLVSVVVADGTASSGGGIYNGNIMTIIRSDIVDNDSLDNGGGITNAGQLEIVDSAMSGNDAVNSGGGIWSLTGELNAGTLRVTGNSAGTKGGGVWVSGGDVVVADTLIADNDAAQGGGIHMQVEMSSVFRSAILNNTATAEGGGVYAAEDGFIRRSTIAGNSAPSGGGVYANNNMLLLDHVTVAGNLAGGGAFNQSGLQVEGTLFAANAGGNCLGNAVGFGAYNLDDADTCGFIDNPGIDQPNFPNTDPLLGPLADHGGPTPTFSLLPGSPAIDATNNTLDPNCQNFPDQRRYPRGRPRVVNPDMTETFFCDIGAYEANTPMTVDSTVDEADDDLDDDLCLTANGTCTLRAAIQQANAIAQFVEIDLPAGEFVLTEAGANEDAAASGDLDIIHHVEIRGAGSGQTIIDANGLDRAFHFTGGTFELTILNRTASNIEDVTITGGSIDFSDYGSAVLAARPLRMDRTVVSENSGGSGAIACGRLCWLEVYDSTVRNNDGFIGSFWHGFTGGADPISHVLIERSTIHQNTSNIAAAGQFDRLRLNNSTVSDNSANSTGAFHIAKSSAFIDSTIVDNEGVFDTGGVFLSIPGTHAMRNSIIAGNIESTCDGCVEFVRNCFFRVTSLGHNVTDTIAGDCGLFDATDQTLVDPLLANLAMNGGFTATRGLLSGSPAIDSGDDANCPTLDQRGFFRPQDGDGNGSAICDAGAFELSDTDGDGVPDTLDNCLLVDNPDQIDTDSDNFGNICDADFDNDCITNAVDLGIFKANFFQPGITDMNGDGLTNVLDLGLLKLAFFMPPGPSGLPTSCTTP